MRYLLTYLKPLSLLLLLNAYFYPAYAELDAKGQHIVEMTNNKDYACTQCHNPGNSKGFKSGKLDHKGFHVGSLTETAEPITCTNCHGNASLHHRDGIKDVLKFQPDLFSSKQDYRPDEQNAVCFTCHKPAELQAAFWPHDVHVNKLSCAGCHTVHVDTKEQDPMRQLNSKSQVTLCVTCHQKQTDTRLQKNKDIQP